MRLRRSLLFVPGDRLDRIKKASSLSADCIILDLEDSVAPDQKNEARATSQAALHDLSFGPRERLIRINALSTEWFSQDLQMTIPARPDGYVLPKAESAQQIATISHFLSNEERSRGWEEGSIRLLALIETARGVLNLQSIASADSRLDALVLGAEDLASDLGAQRSAEGWEIFHARSQLILVASAYSLQPIDTVFVHLNDPDGLEEESLRVRQMGFEGKLAIHPSQLETIQLTFTPSPEEIAQAQKLIDAYHEHQIDGKGAFLVEGRMVDLARVRAAKKTLQKAEAVAQLKV